MHVYKSIEKGKCHQHQQKEVKGKRKKDIQPNFSPALPVTFPEGLNCQHPSLHIKPVPPMTSP